MRLRTKETSLLQSPASQKQVKYIAKLAADLPRKGPADLPQIIINVSMKMTSNQAAQLIDILTEAPLLLPDFLARFGVMIKRTSVFNRAGIMKRAWWWYRKTVSSYQKAATRTTFGACLRLAWREAFRQLAKLKLMYLDLNEAGIASFATHFDSPEAAVAAIGASRAPTGDWRERFGVDWYEEQCLLQVISWIAAENGFTNRAHRYPKIRIPDLQQFFRFLRESESVCSACYPAA